MRLIHKTCLLPAALLLLLLPSCNKSDKKGDGPGTNTWTVQDPSTGSSSPTYFAAAKIARQTDGTFRATGSDPNNYIIFSFYQNKLPKTNGTYTSYTTTDSALNLSYVVNANGVVCQSHTPSSVVMPITISVEKGKLHIVMPGQEARDANGRRMYVAADLQEP